MWRTFLLSFVCVSYLTAQSAPGEAADPLEPARSALQTGNVTQAVSVLQDLLVKTPQAPGARALLAGVLLDQDRIEAAEEVVRKGLASDADPGPLHCALGDIEFRKGHLKVASTEYSTASRLNPKDARAVYGVGRVAAAYSLNAAAYRLFRLANRLNPRDETIVGAFTRFAATDQEQAQALEQYLASLDRNGRRNYQWLVARLELRKFLAGKHTWVLASPYQPSKIRLHTLLIDPRRPYGVGVEVSVNGAKPETLLVDTGAGGIIMNRVMAAKAHVQRIADLDVGGIGDKADPTGYLGFAESIRVGDVEFHNCVVHVSDKKSVVESAGLIGPSVFDRFLITMDFVHRSLILDPLPGPAWDGETPVDRYQGKELEGFTRVLRAGSDLLVATRIEEGPDRLFLLDSGSSTTMMSTAAAHDVTKVHRDDSVRITGVSGEVDKVYSADKVMLQFAGFRQENRDVTAIDLSGVSRSEGTEISGIMGLPLIVLFRITLDYRDGAVKFDYVHP